MKSAGLFIAFCGAIVGLIGLIMGCIVHFAKPGSVTVDVADRPFVYAGAGAVIFVFGLIIAGNAP